MMEQVRGLAYLILESDTGLDHCPRILLSATQPLTSLVSPLCNPTHLSLTGGSEPDGVPRNLAADCDDVGVDAADAVRRPRDAGGRAEGARVGGRRHRDAQGNRHLEARRYV